jgi:methionyl-tRNA formyltransferase
MAAACFGRIKAVKSLIDLGANVNATNYKGTTVLMFSKKYALKSGCNKIFRELLLAGADLEKMDLVGKKLADYVTRDELRFLKS